MTLRIAMWSGPRNISTAMMRAWENRKDTVVWDEPFYGHYLEQTGIPHPGADEVIADQGTDWRAIAAECANGPIANGPRGYIGSPPAIFYQKHMTMHLLPRIDRGWLSNVVNCFLIRSPKEVIASYAKVRSDLTLEDLGFVQQAALFDFVIKISGEIPLVIDSTDFLGDPESMLVKICQRLGIPFRTEMIAWPEGPRDSDGVWAKYWYDNVWASTTFGPHTEKSIHLDDEQARICSDAQPYYDMLYQYRLQP